VPGGRSVRPEPVRPTATVDAAEHLREKGLSRGVETATMAMESDVVVETDAPADWPREHIDARELPPPQPLQRTLERLAELDDETVLVQSNDRAPQHLYPKLEDRGYVYDTVEDEDVVRTVIWPAASDE
jgi:TusA-related sulfurtransferase